MNNLTKEKKQQLGVVAMITVALLVGIWFGLVNAQQKRRADILGKTEGVKKQLAEADTLLKKEDEIADALDRADQELRDREATLPPLSSAFQWMIGVANASIKPDSSLANFITSAPGNAGDVGILPSFPYKAVTYSVSLSGFFADFGKFLADFENERPYLRVQNLTLIPASALPGDEKLTFNFDVVSLTMTNQAVAPK